AGLRVGNAEDHHIKTGTTVLVADKPFRASVDVMGGSPGSRETDLLAPDKAGEAIDALVLSGGSAFGLDAASGVMTFLEERGIGFKVMSHGMPAVVPIVPAAVLIDLGVGGSVKIRPDAECGYRAAATAATGIVAEGSVGAGAGATVGKSAGYQRAMKGGVGSASITSPDGLVVGALVAVNALGDVIDPGTG
ncbi:MAG: P1 family peptidase, partial [Vicinamibacterales bacterium]